MADNLDITEGTGTTIKTDDIGGVHYQQIKLVDGTLDAAGVIAADIGVKANALRTAPANDITDATYIGDIKFGESLPAGTNAIGKLAANSGIDIGDVDILSIAAGDNNIGNVDIVTQPADTFAADAQAYGKGVLCQGDDGTDRRAILVGTDGHVQCDVLALPASTNTIEVVGDAANNAAITGNPIAIGVLYDSTKPTVLDDGDVGYALADSYGRLLAGVEPEWFNAIYDSSDATAEGKVVKAATAGKKIYIMSYIISSDVEGWIKLQDEDSNALTGKFWLKAGGGVAWTAPPNAPLVLNVANKALEVICEAAGDISVTVTAYLAP